MLGNFSLTIHVSSPTCALSNQATTWLRKPFKCLVETSRWQTCGCKGQELKIHKIGTRNFKAHTVCSPPFDIPSKFEHPRTLQSNISRHNILTDNYSLFYSLRQHRMCNRLTTTYKEPLDIFQNSHGEKSKQSITLAFCPPAPLPLSYTSRC